MKLGGTDWLDRVALRSSGSSGRVQEPEAAPTSGEETLSRAAAVKLAVATTASLSLGLWRASAGGAQEPPGLTPAASKCFAGCYTNLEKNLKKSADFCDRLGTDFFKTPPSSWARIKAAFAPVPGVTVIREAISAACTQAAEAVYRDAKNRCIGNCEEECRKKAQGSRSLQSSRQICEPTPPPPPYTPAPPPAPSYTEDACWACIEGSKGVPVTCCVGRDYEACLCAPGNIGAKCSDSPLCA